MSKNSEDFRIRVADLEKRSEEIRKAAAEMDRQIEQLKAEIAKRYEMKSATQN